VSVAEQTQRAGWIRKSRRGEQRPASFKRKGPDWLTPVCVRDPSPCLPPHSSRGQPRARSRLRSTPLPPSYQSCIPSRVPSTFCERTDSSRIKASYVCFPFGRREVVPWPAIQRAMHRTPATGFPQDESQTTSHMSACLSMPSLRFQWQTPSPVTPPQWDLTAANPSPKHVRSIGASANDLA
jgi:hypothetical protein